MDWFVLFQDNEAGTIFYLNSSTRLESKRTPFVTSDDKKKWRKKNKQGRTKLMWRKPATQEKEAHSHCELALKQRSPPGAGGKESRPANEFHRSGLATQPLSDQAGLSKLHERYEQSQHWSQMSELLTSKLEDQKISMRFPSNIAKESAWRPFAITLTRADSARRLALLYA